MPQANMHHKASHLCPWDNVSFEEVIEAVAAWRHPWAQGGQPPSTQGSTFVELCRGFREALAELDDPTNRTTFQLALVEWLYALARANIKRGRVFDLAAVLGQGRADCLGYAKLFAVLARASGLDAGIVEVVIDNAGRHVPHTLNLICLANGGWRLVDFWHGSTNIGHRRLGLEVLEDDVWRVKDADWEELLQADGIRPLPDEALSAITLYILGNRHLDRDEYQAGLDCYTEALRLYPGNARFHFNRAIARDNLGDAEGARQDYARALSDEDSLTRVLATEHDEIVGLIELDERGVPPKIQDIYLLRHGFITGKPMPPAEIAAALGISEDEVGMALSEAPATQ